MNALYVFGASGVVGQFLCQRLQSTNRAFVALTRQLPKPDDSSSALQWQICDLWRDHDACTATTIISTGPLDAFVHWLSRATTTQLTRVIALSSMSIEAKRDSADEAERAVAMRLQQAEEELRNTCDRRDIHWTILRPTLIWGSDRDQSLTALFRLAQRWHFVPVPIADGGWRQPVHADDVASACCIALNEPETYQQTIALGGGERLRVHDIWARVIRAAGAYPLPVPLPLLRLGSVLIGARSPTLKAALGRWHADQIVTPELPTVLSHWQPRSFQFRP